MSYLTHIDNLRLSLSQICYSIYRLVNIITTGVIGSYACFESGISQGTVYWCSSTPSIREFRFEKRAIRTMAGASQRCSCRNLFKQLGILLPPSMYMRCSDLPRNSDIHSYPTRETSNFLIPKYRSIIYENNPLYVGIKLYNKINLPYRIENRETVQQTNIFTF